MARCLANVATCNVWRASQDAAILTLIFGGRGKTNAIARDVSGNGQALTIGVAVKPGANGKLEGIAGEFFQIMGHNAAQGGSEITAIVLYSSRKGG